MRVYLDMCTLQRPLDDRSQLRIHLEAEAVIGILLMCQRGEAVLLASLTLYLEAIRNPYPERQGFTMSLLARASEVSGAEELIEQRARGYIERGIKPVDALHLASAVEAKAEYFCTCDDRLLKRAKRLDTGETRVLNPLELIEEMER